MALDPLLIPYLDNLRSILKELDVSDSTMSRLTSLPANKFHNGRHGGKITEEESELILDIILDIYPEEYVNKFFSKEGRYHSYVFHSQFKDFQSTVKLSQSSIEKDLGIAKNKLHLMLNPYRPVKENVDRARDTYIKVLEYIENKIEGIDLDYYYDSVD